MRKRLRCFLGQHRIFTSDESQRNRRSGLYPSSPTRIIKIEENCVTPESSSRKSYTPLQINSDQREVYSDDFESESEFNDFADDNRIISAWCDQMKCNLNQLVLAKYKKKCNRDFDCTQQSSFSPGKRVKQYFTSTITDDFDDSQESFTSECFECCKCCNNCKGKCRQNPSNDAPRKNSYIRRQNSISHVDRQKHSYVDYQPYELTSETPPSGTSINKECSKRRKRCKSGVHPSSCSDKSYNSKCRKRRKEKSAKIKCNKRNCKKSETSVESNLEEEEEDEILRKKCKNLKEQYVICKDCRKEIGLRIICPICGKVGPIRTSQISPTFTTQFVIPTNKIPKVRNCFTNLGLNKKPRTLDIGVETKNILLQKEVQTNPFIIQNEQKKSFPNEQINLVVNNVKTDFQSSSSEKSLTFLDKIKNDRIKNEFEFNSILKETQQTYCEKMNRLKDQLSLINCGLEDTEKKNEFEEKINWFQNHIEELQNKTLQENRNNIYFKPSSSHNTPRYQKRTTMPIFNLQHKTTNFNKNWRKYNNRQDKSKYYLHLSVNRKQRLASKLGLDPKEFEYYSEEGKRKNCVNSSRSESPSPSLQQALLHLGRRFVRRVARKLRQWAAGPSETVPLPPPHKKRKSRAALRQSFTEVLTSLSPRDAKRLISDEVILLYSEAELQNKIFSK